jgi:hypothetical protein
MALPSWLFCCVLGFCWIRTSRFQILIRQWILTITGTKKHQNAEIPQLQYTLETLGIYQLVADPGIFIPNPDLNIFSSQIPDPVPKIFST